MKTTDTTTGMTVFRIKDLKRWQDRVITRVQAAGRGGIRKGSACQLWSPTDIRPVAGTSVRYVDGVRVVRERIARGVGALAVIPRRMYFEEGAPTPTPIPERTLLGSRRIPLPPPAKRIRACLDWGHFLAGQVPGFEANPMPVARVRNDLQTLTQLIFGGGHRIDAGTKVSTSLMKHGFYRVPDALRIILAHPESGRAQAKVYQQLIATALQRCHAHGMVTLTTYEGLTRRWTDQSDTNTPAKSTASELCRASACGSPDTRLATGEVVLLAVTGCKGEPLSSTANNLIQTMTAQSIPFRMFSLDNPSLNWAALDQVGTLIAAAGGLPYVLDLPWSDDQPPPYLIGVDLGHPLKSRVSHAVISLLDHQGTLLGSWRQEQRRDETFDPAALEAGLKWAHTAACAHSGQTQPRFLVLRDGRLNKGESVTIYQRVLGQHMTFVEFAKYDNPETFRADKTISAALAGTECILPDSDVRFVTPISPRLANDLARTFKVNAPPQWDGLNLGADRISEILIGLSYAPGLGLAPHALPAPIYWADGIAAVGEKNHQFAGITPL